MEYFKHWRPERVVTRRVALGSAAGVGLSICAGLVASRAEEPAAGGAGLAFDAALERLKSGNDRFVRDELQHHHSSREWRAQLKETQHPFATLLCCSDSRVPPELVFDQGFGDLFIVRVAGNIIATDVLGSIQYASHHLHTPLFVVLGHEGCGAVTAAVDALLGQGREPAHIARLVEMITPGLKQLDLNLPRQQLIEAAVEANVRWSMRQLLNMPEARRALEERRAQLVGAVYSLESGAVRFLDNAAQK
jgi:carbonic anhydrase